MQVIAEKAKARALCDAGFCEFQIVVAAAYDMDFRPAFQILPGFFTVGKLSVAFFFKRTGRFLQRQIVFEYISGKVRRLVARR